MLNKLGYKASVKAISGNIQFTYIQNTKNKVQISVTQWYQDYPAPSDFLYVLFGCDSFHPGSDTSVNIAGFCDKKIHDDMKKALRSGITDRRRATSSGRRSTTQITDEAPLAVAVQPEVTSTSSRSGSATSCSAASTT